MAIFNSGAGTIQNNAGGVLTVRNQEILGVNTVNDGIDAVGRHKLSLSLPTGSSQLSLGDLPAGTYLVAVYRKQQLIDRLRFVKL